MSTSGRPSHWTWACMYGCVHCVRLCSLCEVVLCAYLWQAVTLDVGLCVRLCSLCEVVFTV